MKIKKTKIKDRIYLLEFESQKDITSTFLRFQEHYESPEFRGKIFTLKEFRKWYSRENAEFTYYEDWSAFNIPYYVLEPFFEGKFNPLSDKEEQLLSLFDKNEKDYYIIGIYKGSHQEILKHEIAHALFYTIPEYREKVLQLLKKYKLEIIEQELKSKDGYHDEVIEDELHAWILTLPDELKTKAPKELKEKLKKLFDDYY
jgi:hypothetical protein